MTIDGRRTVTLLEGTKKQRTATDAGANKLFHFAVAGGKAGPRRATVSTAKRNACHASLAAVIHGGSCSTTESERTTTAMSATRAFSATAPRAR